MAPARAGRLSMSAPPRSPASEKSMGDTGDRIDHQDHRRGRLSRPGRISERPTCLSLSYGAESAKAPDGWSARPHGPRSYHLTSVGVHYYVYKDLGAGSAGPAAQGFQLNPIRVAPLADIAASAIAREILL